MHFLTALSRSMPLKNTFLCISTRLWAKHRTFSLHPYLKSNFCSEKKANNRYKIDVIPALKDNYMYILTDKFLQSAIAVDPVEPDKIFQILDREKISLKAVLTTHHHFDHAGGNDIIAKRVGSIPIYGGDDRIEAMTHKLSHDEMFDVGNLTIKCLHTPCHTSGHVCYYIVATGLGYICFTGDTLFVGGCGRFFEGTASQMLKSLNTLSALPKNTLIYCGHEYTLSNLKFALSVEPSNESALKKFKVVEENLKLGKPSVPSTIEEELSYNPFMRTSKKAVQLYTKQTDPSAVMKILREEKDKF